MGERTGQGSVVSHLRACIRRDIIIIIYNNNFAFYSIIRALYANQGRVVSVFAAAVYCAGVYKMSLKKKRKF